MTTEAPATPAYIRSTTSMLGTAPSFGSHKFVIKHSIIPVDDTTRSLLTNPKFAGQFEPVEADYVATLRYCQPCGVYFDNAHVEAKHLAAHAEQERGHEALHALRQLKAQDELDRENITRAREAIKQRRQQREQAEKEVAASGYAVAVIVNPPSETERFLKTPEAHYAYQEGIDIADKMLREEAKRPVPPASALIVAEEPEEEFPF